MISPNANESASRQIETIEQEITALRNDQAAGQARVTQLLHDEDPANGILFHAEIFRLQQDKLRLDTEIQFRQVALRRLKSTW